MAIGSDLLLVARKRGGHSRKLFYDFAGKRKNSEKDFWDKID